MNIRISHRIHAAIILAISFTSGLMAGEPRLVRDQATSYTPPLAAPAASDVTMRSLRFHPRNKTDPHDTLKAVADFHATRLEWVPLADGGPAEQASIQRVEDLGVLFGASSGGGSGVPSGRSLEEDLAIKKRFCILDINGNPIVPEFKKGWGGDRVHSGGCANNPEYRKRHLAHNLMEIEAGADVLQRDEASGNHAVAQNASGCYCAHCMIAFRDYLKNQLTPSALEQLGIPDVGTFDYAEQIRKKALPTGDAGIDWSDDAALKKAGREIKRTPLFEHFEKFQAASMVAFYRWLRSSIDARAGRRVPMSCNNTSYQNWEQPYYLEFDFALSELMVASADPARIYERAQRARSLGKLQVFGTPKTMGQAYDEAWLVRLRRQVIATAYAAGGLSPVPWDCFEQTKGGDGRYFGQPAEYADLFAFIRGNARYLDGYATAGAIGPGIRDGRYGDQPPVIVEGANDKTYLFLRAVPKDGQAAVIIHAVDWNQQESKSIRLKLRTGAFFPPHRLAVALRTPEAYDPAAHAAAGQQAESLRKPGERLGAAQAAAFAPLVAERNLPTAVEGPFTAIELPPLNPWGILVISQAP